jgi:hypothetical protein
VAALAEGLHAADLAPPLHDAARKRVQQYLPQLAARHLRTLARAVVGSVEQNSPCPVQNPIGLAAGQDKAAELLDQAGRLERWLAVPGVDVKQPTLRARGRRGLRFIDRDPDAMHVQDASQDETAEASPDDSNWCRHRAPPNSLDYHSNDISTGLE